MKKRTADLHFLFCPSPRARHARRKGSVGTSLALKVFVLVAMSLLSCRAAAWAATASSTRWSRPPVQSGRCAHGMGAAGARVPNASRLITRGRFVQGYVGRRVQAHRLQIACAITRLPGDNDEPSDGKEQGIKRKMGRGRTRVGDNQKKVVTLPQRIHFSTRPFRLPQRPFPSHESHGTYSAQCKALRRARRSYQTILFSSPCRGGAQN